MSPDYPVVDLAAWVSVVIGLLACFIGYRVFRLVLGAMGFVLGALLAGALFWALVQEPEILALVAALAGGLIGAAVFLLFYYVGVFVVGAGFGALLGIVLATQFGIEQVVLAAVLGIVGGVLALGVQRFLITTSTAFIGAWVALSSGYFLLGYGEPPSALVWPKGLADDGSAAFLVAWVLLGSIGLAFQLRFAGSQHHRRKPKSAD